MNPAEEHDKEFVEYIVKEIVDIPEKVQVERKIDEMGVLLELTVAPEDMGKVIGKEGNTAKSIRTLLRVLGAKNNARVNLKIIEPEGGKGDRRDETPVESTTSRSAPASELISDQQAVEEPTVKEETPVIQPIEEEKTTPLE